MFSNWAKVSLLCVVALMYGTVAQRKFENFLYIYRNC